MQNRLRVWKKLYGNHPRENYLFKWLPVREKKTLSTGNLLQNFPSKLSYKVKNKSQPCLNLLRQIESCKMSACKHLKPTALNMLNCFKSRSNSSFVVL